MEISSPPLGKVNLHRVGKHVLIDDFGRFEANAIRHMVTHRCVGWRVEDKELGRFTEVRSRAEVKLLIYNTMSKELPKADRENIHKKLVSIANSYKDIAPVGSKSVPPNSFDYCHMFGILDALVTLGYISRASSNYKAPYYTDLQFWMDQVFTEVFAS